MAVPALVIRFGYFSLYVTLLRVHLELFLVLVVGQEDHLDIIDHDLVLIYNSIFDLRRNIPKNVLVCVGLVLELMKSNMSEHESVMILV